MKLPLVLLSLVLLAVPFLPIHAQTGDFSANDKVITVTDLKVYARHDVHSTVVDQLPPGMVSYVLQEMTDSDGTVWVYLADNAYGWVQVQQGDLAALVPYSDGAMQKLIDYASELLKTDPNNIDAYVQRATAHASQYDYERGLSDYNVAIRLAPKNGQLYDLHAKVNLNQGAYQDAVNNSEQAMHYGWVLPNTYNRLALGYEVVQRTSESLETFEKAIDLAPDYALLRNNRGVMYTDLKVYDQALTDFNAAISLDPLLSLAYNGRANIHRRQGQINSALADLNKALDINPNCEDCLVTRGAIYADQLGENVTALADLQKATSLIPHDGQAFANLGLVEYRLGMNVEALRDEDRAVLLSPDSEFVAFPAGYVYAANDMYEKAIQAFTVSVNKGDTTYYPALLNRAQVYLALGRYDEAIDDLNVYIDETIPSNGLASALLLRGAAYLYQHDYKNASEDYRLAAVNAAPGDHTFVSRFETLGTPYRVTTERTAQDGAIPEPLSKPLTDKDYQLATTFMEYGHWPKAAIQYENYFKRLGQPMPDELRAIIEMMTQ